VLKNRPLLLVLLCVGLAALVWLDNRGEPAAPPRPAPAALQAEDPAGEPAAHDAAAADPEGGAAQPEADGATPAAPQLANPLASFDKETLKDWVERPLFAPSRKRPPPSEASAGSVKQNVAIPLAPTYDLLGIIREGERALALLRKKGDGANFRVEVGDMIGGWRVAKIEPRSVVLERADGSSQTMTLTR
jgi:hypothetical protein